MYEALRMLVAVLSKAVATDVLTKERVPPALLEGIGR